MQRGTRFLLLAGLSFVIACSNDGGEPLVIDGSDGGGGAGGAPAVNDALGLPCTSDDDCADAGLVCIVADGDGFLGGGPQGGMCAAPCTDGGQAACDAIDAQSVCVDASDPDGVASTNAWCLPACERGAPGDGKCLGRVELACARAEDGSQDFCQPACESDAGCAPGQCDLERGVCVAVGSRTGTLPVGSECDPADDGCAGACLSLDEAGTTLACSGGCSLGSPGCGADASATSLDAYCLLPASSDATIGDLGLCVALCDCDTPCAHASLICESAGEQGESLTGRAGFCVPAARSTSPVACAP